MNKNQIKDRFIKIDSNEQIMIGMHRESGSISDPFKGQMDQIRISNSARYTSAFTPPGIISKSYSSKY